VLESTKIEIIYLGFVLPGLFALTLVAEGLYKIANHEEGFFTFVIGILFLISLTLAYFLLFNKL